MKQIVIILLVCSQAVNAQDTLSFKMIKSFSYEFNIENGRFKGRGADSLMFGIQRSHFVLLGETHDDEKIAEFTSVLLSDAQTFGYKYFFTEHGRYGLDLLIEEAIKDSTLVAGICQINSREHKRLNEYPFPFLTGVEDAKFVSTALKQGYKIYGIDQEFFYSFPFLFDKLFDQVSKSESVKKDYEAALAFLFDEYAKDASKNNYPICRNLLQSEDIQTFFRHLQTDPYLRKIVNDIRQSWEIYEMNRINRQESFVLRGDLMRNRFMAFYDSIAVTDFNAKYIIKLGALHTMRGTTPLGIEDIGETVHQTALKGGQKDLNIYFMFRYYLDEEEELGYFDNSEGKSTWLKERRPMMLQGKPDNWTIVDLVKLKNLVESRKLFVYQAIKDIINQYDYVLIPPASRDVTENRK